jgi:zinc transport system ATP-binding protein
MTDQKNELLAVHIENLTVRYGQTTGVKDVCLDVREREYLGIIGPNGGGKSTLLKSILGLVPATTGTVRVFGMPISEGRKLVGYVPQQAVLDKRFPITLEEVVLTGAIRKGISPFFRYSNADRDTARSLMCQVGVEKLADRQVSQLSGGEFQEMLITRALATKPKLLMLDEPTASVDAISREQIYELLARLNREITIMDGPTVADGYKAIETGNVNYILKWVPPEDEKEMADIFDLAMKVRELSPEAKELSEKYLFDSLVRMHRAAEGAPFTGVKPSGTPIDEKVMAADEAILTGDLSKLEAMMKEEKLPELRERFDNVMLKKDFDVNGDRPSFCVNLEAVVE